MPRTIGLNVASAGAGPVVCLVGTSSLLFLRLFFSNLLLVYRQCRYRCPGEYAGGADGIGFLLISATDVQSRAALQSQSDQLDLHFVVKFKRLVQCNSNRYLEKGYLPIK